MRKSIFQKNLKIMLLCIFRFREISLFELGLLQQNLGCILSFSVLRHIYMVLYMHAYTSTYAYAHNYCQKHENLIAVSQRVQSQMSLSVKLHLYKEVYGTHFSKFLQTIYIILSSMNQSVEFNRGSKSILFGIGMHLFQIKSFHPLDSKHYIHR